MGRCLVLVGLLAAAVGALVACDGPTPPPATYKSPDDGPWRVFVGDEGIAARDPHDTEHRRTQVGTRPTEQWTQWRLSRPLQVALRVTVNDEDGPATGRVWPTRGWGVFDLPEPWTPVDFCVS